MEISFENGLFGGYDSNESGRYQPSHGTVRMRLYDEENPITGPGKILDDFELPIYVEVQFSSGKIFVTGNFEDLEKILNKLEVYNLLSSDNVYLQSIDILADLETTNTGNPVYLQYYFNSNSLVESIDKKYYSI